jgi:hypothetical protein
MMRRLQSLCLALALVGLPVPGTFVRAAGRAQGSESNVFGRLLDATASAKKQLGTDDAKRADDRAVLLYQRWNAVSSPDLPGEYLRMLEHEAGLLEKAAAQPDGPASDDVRAAADDLALMLGRASQGLNAQGALGAVVAVTVRTFVGSAEQGGYRIECSPRRYADPAHPMFPFGSDSSPTSRQLPPGNYVFWVRSGDAIVATGQYVVGETLSSDKQELKITVRP